MLESNSRGLLARLHQTPQVQNSLLPRVAKFTAASAIKRGGGGGGGIDIHNSKLNAENDLKYSMEVL